LGFAEPDAERVALAATELATNLVRHAIDGELLIAVCSEQGQRGVELISLDGGPGMRDPGACFRDGYSTTGGAGTGLGAAQRLSDLLDLYSQPGEGTVIVARLVPRQRRPAQG